MADRRRGRAFTAADHVDTTFAATGATPGTLSATAERVDVEPLTDTLTVSCVSPVTRSEGLS